MEPLTAEHLPSWILHPYRLVSLGEIVRRFRPTVFVDLAKSLGGLMGAENTLEGFARLLSNIGLDVNAAHVANTTEVSGHLRADAIGHLLEFEQEAAYFNLGTACITSQRIRALLDKPESTVGQLLPLVRDLVGRLSDELSLRVFFSLTLPESEHYNNPQSGWEPIIARFPDTVGDIEEARKCFALARYAGSVLHSVQVIEIGLIDLGHFLGIKDRRPGWTATTNALKAIIDKKPQDRTQFEQQHFVFIEQAQGTAEALKNAWRNKVSHAHDKLVVMTADFSPAVAEEILIATRGFMRRLASDLPPVVGVSP